MNNPKGMVRGDGGFTEGMFFVIFFNQGGFSTPHPPLNSSPDYSLIKALTSTLAKCLSNSYQVPIKTKKEGKQTVNNIAILLLSLSLKSFCMSRTSREGLALWC